MAWTTYTLETGEYLIEGLEIDPNDPGSEFALDPDTQGATETRFDVDLTVHSWNTETLAWEEDPAKLAGYLITLVKDQARAQRALVASPEKDSIYSNKQAELQAWTALGVTDIDRLAAFEAMPDDPRSWIFLYSITEAALAGEPDIAAALSRFEAGAKLSEARKAMVEAIEQTTIAALKAAPTVTEVRAIFAAIDWG